jgi:hypothetical protein
VDNFGVSDQIEVSEGYDFGTFSAILDSLGLCSVFEVRLMQS